MSEAWSVLRLLRWTADFFRQHGVETHRLDAEVLLAHVLACKRVDLYLTFDQPVAAVDRERFRLATLVADAAGGRLRAGQIDVGDHHDGAELGETKGGGLADAGSAAHHQRDAVGEIEQGASVETGRDHGFLSPINSLPILTSE